MHVSPLDRTIPVPPGTTPAYASGNPVHRLLHLVERVAYSAETEYYLLDEVQYLFSIRRFDWHGPSGADAQVLDPLGQLNKEDFQKQNVRDFATGPLLLARGWVGDGAFRTPFLRISYQGGPDTPLGPHLGRQARLWLKVNDIAAPASFLVPYNEATDRYEVELWGYTGSDLRDRLDTKGRQAYDRGELVARPDLIRGHPDAFARENVDQVRVVNVAPDHLMHPLLPCRVECAWANEAGTVWDNNEQRNYRLEFNMLLRGWDNFLSSGVSANPHGGVGTLQFLNLFSNYFGHKDRPELGRTLEAWNLDAYGQTGRAGFTEKFMAVDYIDLHLLHANSSIGLHRHRDNQELFMILRGQGYMVTGDWCQTAERERSLEVRKLRPGSMALLKPGGLHALVNNTDANMELFMFGGYD